MIQIHQRIYIFTCSIPRVSKKQRLYQDEDQLERTGHFSCKNSLSTQIEGTCDRVNKNTVLGVKKLGFNPNSDIYLLSELGQCPHL